MSIKNRYYSTLLFAILTADLFKLNFLYIYEDIITG